jgi:glycosyltransferase involved in cell wall biosynthesis
MNVLQIVPELNAGGVERTVIEVAQALTDAGHTAHVASGGGRMVGALKQAGGIIHKLPMASKNPVVWTLNTRRLRKLIREQAIDIVHARSRAPAFAARDAARAEGVGFVTTYHGIYNARSALKRRYNAVMASGDLVIANSNYTRDHITAEHGTDPARLRVIPRGVDMARFDPAKVTGDFRGQWGMPDDVPLWLLPGRMTAWKGQKVAIRARAQDPDAQLVLIGDAQGRNGYMRDLRELSHRLGVMSRVLIVPHSSDMPKVFASADVVISASTDPEAFGRVAAEAQAMGKPVVATAHGGALETIEDGVTGRLVPPGDAASLAQACAEVLGWEYDGAGARARIHQFFSDTRLKHDVLAVYAEVLSGTFSPPHALK